MRGTSKQQERFRSPDMSYDPSRSAGSRAIAPVRKILTLRGLLRMLLHLLFTHLLHPMRTRHMPPLLHPWPR